MYRGILALLMALLMTADEQRPADRVSGFRGITFGSASYKALVAVGADAGLAVLCGPHEAVIFRDRHLDFDVAVKAYLVADRVADIELLLEDGRVQSNRAQCLAIFDSVLTSESQNYRSYEFTQADKTHGWVASRTAELRFTDSSSIEIRSKYWPAGGTCYTYVTYRPPVAPGALEPTATSY